MLYLFDSSPTCEWVAAKNQLRTIYDILTPMRVCGWPDADEWLASSGDDDNGASLAREYVLDITEVARLRDPSPDTVYSVSNASLFCRIVRSAIDRDDHRIVITPCTLSRRDTVRAIRWADCLSCDRPKIYRGDDWLFGGTCINADERVIFFAHNSGRAYPEVVRVLKSLFVGTQFV